MSDDQLENSDPEGAKLKAWLLGRRGGEEINLKREIKTTGSWLWGDFVFKLRSGIVGAAIGTVIGAIGFEYLGLDWKLGVIPGAIIVGCITFAVAFGPFRR